MDKLPNKGEIWSLRVKDTSQTIIRNIVNINPFFVTLIDWKERKVKAFPLTDIIFISNMSTPQDGTKLSKPLCVKGESTIKESICDHEWVFEKLSYGLYCKHCGKAPDVV